MTAIVTPRRYGSRGRTGPRRSAVLPRWSVVYAVHASDSLGVAGVRQHALAVAIVALVAAAAGFFLTVGRPRFRASTAHAPSVPVPYSHVQFTVGDANHAFAAVGVRLVAKSRVPGVVTTMGSRDDALEVDVFGDPARVDASGSPDVLTNTRGKYVRIPSTCRPGIADAARWRGNVRFLIRCADAAHSRLLALGIRALAKL